MPRETKIILNLHNHRWKELLKRNLFWNWTLQSAETALAVSGSLLLETLPILEESILLVKRQTLDVEMLGNEPRPPLPTPLYSLPCCVSRNSSLTTCRSAQRRRGIGGSIAVVRVDSCISLDSCLFLAVNVGLFHRRAASSASSAAQARSWVRQHEGPTLRNGFKGGGILIDH